MIINKDVIELLDTVPIIKETVIEGGEDLGFTNARIEGKPVTLYINRAPIGDSVIFILTDDKITCRLTNETGKYQSNITGWLEIILINLIESYKKGMKSASKSNITYIEPKL